MGKTGRITDESRRRSQLLQGTKDKNCTSNKLQKQVKQAAGQRARGSG